MNKAIWIAKKNEICSLIKQISDTYGGDEIEFLREYAKGIINDYQNDLDMPLDCFYYLFNNLNIKKNVKQEKNCKKYIQCSICGYFPPFCYYHKTNVCSRS